MVEAKVKSGPKYDANALDQEILRDQQSPEVDHVIIKSRQSPVNDNEMLPSGDIL